MLKRKGSTLILAICFVLLIVLVAGCGKNSNNEGGSENTTPNSSDNSTARETDEMVTLKVFFSGAISGAAVPDGLQNDRVVKGIEEKIGVKLDFIGNTTDEVFTTYLAGGEIPDLTMVRDAKLFPQIIQGNLAVNMDDLIQSHGKNILENAGPKVEFSRNNFSNDTGNLYVIPGPSGPGRVDDTYTFGFNVRWDLYKELGYPELETYMDILPLLKQMQDMEPTNEMGQKVYGLSLNTDWDGPTSLYTLLMAPMYGWDTTEHQWHAEVDNVNNFEVKSMFDPDSWMFKGAEFLYEANQLGLLDPDSISQQFSTRDEKMKSGRILASFVHWDVNGYNTMMRDAGHPEKGIMPIYPKDSTTMWEFGSEPNGIGGGWLISSKTDHPEKAMEFLDFINSYEGSMLIQSGIEGEHWIEKDGKPYMTDETIEALKDPEFVNRSGVGKYYNASGLNEWNIHPEYGEMLGYRQWATTKERTYSELYLDYISYYGVDAPYEVYDLQRTKEAESDIYRPYMDVMPDDIALINQKISDMVKNEIYKMIFATNDNEMKKIKDSMISRAEDLGIDKELEWIRQNREKAKSQYEEANGL